MCIGWDKDKKLNCRIVKVSTISNKRVCEWRDWWHHKVAHPAVEQCYQHTAQQLHDWWHQKVAHPAAEQCYQHTAQQLHDWWDQKFAHPAVEQCYQHTEQQLTCLRCATLPKQVTISATDELQNSFLTNCSSLKGRTGSAHKMSSGKKWVVCYVQSESCTAQLVGVLTTLVSFAFGTEYYSERSATQGTAQLANQLNPAKFFLRSQWFLL